MAEIINVEEARAYAREHWPSPVVRRPLEALLDDCPRAEFFHVVRCSECEHFLPYDVTSCCGECIHVDGLVGSVHEDDFCCYGRKKEDDA